MKDQLEDFIHQNRQAFDDRVPSRNVWMKIQRKLGFNRSPKILWDSIVMWRAAAILLMGLSLYLMMPRVSESKRDLALKEFTDVEQFYIQQISEKTELIEDFRKNEGMNGFTNDFKQLEAMYMVLKEQMKTQPSQKVKDALVLNLLVRIDLLNQQLQHLESEDKPETAPQEKPLKNV
jgi:hypothetical protein